MEPGEIKEGRWYRQKKFRHLQGGAYGACNDARVIGIADGKVVFEHDTTSDQRFRLSLEKFAERMERDVTEEKK